jgi:pyrroloquinoline quinone (PQQ) biosynthesis protein C
VRSPHRDLLKRHSLAVGLARAELRSASPVVVLQFLAWLVRYVRQPRRVWCEWTGEGWTEIG